MVLPESNTFFLQFCRLFFGYYIQSPTTHFFPIPSCLIAQIIDLFNGWCDPLPTGQMLEPQKVEDRLAPGWRPIVAFKPVTSHRFADRSHCRLVFLPACYPAG